MKSHHPTTHTPRRKRRQPEEAAPGGARAEAPAQSLATLRSPQAGRAQRGAATLGLQRAVGNAQVGRELASHAMLQRDDSPPPTADPGRAEQERRDKQTADAQRPTGERLADASRELVMHYAAEHLRSLGDEALRQLVRAWRESPGGVIAAGAIIGAEGVAYLVGTKGSLPEITIPLDFLAGQLPVLRGAELTLNLSGPVTRPEGIQLGVTFHEAAPRERSASTGGGTPFTPRMTLRAGDVVADGPELGDAIAISGRVPVPHGASAADVAATIAAIRDGSIDVEIGGTPTLRASVLSVTDSFTPDRYGLRAPPIDRHLLVRIRSAVPPMFHQRPEAVDMRTVYVRINGVSSEGEASVKVHLRPFPASQ